MPTHPAGPNQAISGKRTGSTAEIPQAEAGNCGEDFSLAVPHSDRTTPLGKSDPASKVYQ
jgi:hypothetical protein